MENEAPLHQLKIRTDEFPSEASVVVGEQILCFLYRAEVVARRRNRASNQIWINKKMNLTRNHAMRSKDLYFDFRHRGTERKQIKNCLSRNRRRMIKKGIIDIDPENIVSRNTRDYGCRTYSDISKFLKTRFQTILGIEPTSDLQRQGLFALVRLEFIRELSENNRKWAASAYDLVELNARYEAFRKFREGRVFEITEDGQELVNLNIDLGVVSKNAHLYHWEEQDITRPENRSTLQ